MRMTRFRGLLTAVAVCASCTPAQPSSQQLPPGADLVPVPMAGVSGFAAFCDLEDGALRVTVRNDGDAAADASTTRVAFDYSSRLGVADAPAIAAGASAVVRIELPAPLPDGEYDFTITVDAGGAIPESDEANNFGEGKCIP